MGMLDNYDAIDAPFTLTSYVSKLTEGQQVEDVGDVRLNDPSVRQSFGFEQLREDMDIPSQRTQPPLGHARRPAAGRP